MPRKKSEPVVIKEEEKPWSLTQADLDATTNLELAFGTTRKLPPENIIPKAFWDDYNSHNMVYTQMADAMYCGDPVPDAEFEFNQGFDGGNLVKFLSAHLRSFEPTLEHKMVGLAYLISLIITVKEST